MNRSRITAALVVKAKAFPVGSAARQALLACAQLRTAAARQDAARQDGKRAAGDLEVLRKQASKALDFYGRIQFLAGFLKKPAPQVERVLNSKDTQSYANTLVEELGFAPDVAAQFMQRNVDMGLYKAVVVGVRKSNVFSESSAEGVDVDDLVTVLTVGGLQWPGMVWHTGKGEFIDREGPAFPEGESIYYLVGTRLKSKGGSKGGLRNITSLLVLNAQGLCKNWLRSISSTRGEGTSLHEDPSQLSNLGEGTASPPPPSEEMLAQWAYLAQIEKALQGKANATEMRLYQTLLDGMRRGKDLLAYKNKGGGKGELTIKGDEAREHMSTLFGGVRDPVTEQEFTPPSRQALQMAFDKLLPKMVSAMKDLVEGGGIKGLDQKDQDAMRGRDIKDVYRSEVSRTASRTLTAHDRVTLIKQAAALSVGSPLRLAILEELKSKS